MFVNSILKPSHECITFKKEDSLKLVLETLLEKDIQSAPVLENTKFIGMVSKQMIYEKYFETETITKEDFLQNNKVEDIVDHGDLFITKKDVFEKTLTAFKGFPLLAVVDEDANFLGIVTRFEVLEQFESAFGMKKSGVRIAFTSTEAEGRISRLTDILNSFHSNIIAIATFDETDKLLRRIVIKIEKNDNVDRIIKKLEKSGFRILDVKEM
ncbi:CBS domain-containing protein [Salirhabdus sp. Marseille-P4669]|uniref:CBS domain-containing protein n=1 Tax=Salirhabdus sp. Marseille-P4669 TaxID=2042310 RepID=UPI000C7CAA06|nr:CBS domain-containing protein [Salirhabdus sp. Marseille-P4669]